jgi:hypothetical protein
MRFGTLLTVAGTLGTLFGLAFLVAPAFGLQQYGVTTDAAGLFMTQFFGAALLQLGLVFLMLRTHAEANTSRVALGACLGELAGLWVAVRLQLSGGINAMGWSSVAIYGILALAFATFAFRKPQPG